MASMPTPAAGTCEGPVDVCDGFVMPIGSTGTLSHEVWFCEDQEAEVSDAALSPESLLCQGVVGCQQARPDKVILY